MNLWKTAMPLALASAAVMTTAATTNAEEKPSPVPAFDYRDCPPLPAGVDPAEWRCEVHVAMGTLTIGDTGPIRFTITRMTHAEGRLPDGTTGQVFGGLRARAEPVPGGLSGDGGPPLGLRPESAGSADFLTPGGVIEMKFHLVGPRVGRRCTLGSNTDPVRIALARVPGSAVWISQDPPIRRMEGTDTSFTVPPAAGCGSLASTIDRRFALPAPAGTNDLRVTAYYSYKTYDALAAHDPERAR